MNLSFNQPIRISVSIFGSTPTGLTTLPIGLSFIHVQVNDTIYTLDGIIRFYYDPSNLPTGVTEDEMWVMWYNETSSQWQTVDQILNMTGNYIEFNVTGFSYYAIVGIDEQAVGPYNPGTGNPFELLMIILIIAAIAIGAAVPIIVVMRRRSGRRDAGPVSKVVSKEGIGIKLKSIQKLIDQEASIDAKVDVLLKEEITIELIPDLKDFSLLKYIKQDFTAIPIELLEKLQRMDMPQADKIEIINNFKNLSKEAQEEFLKDLNEL